MAQRKSFLLRLDPVTHEALQCWADADLRSLNSQIEFLLRRALQNAGRLKPPAAAPPAPAIPAQAISTQEDQPQSNEE